MLTTSPVLSHLLTLVICLSEVDQNPVGLFPGADCHAVVSGLIPMAQHGQPFPRAVRSGLVDSAAFECDLGLSRWHLMVKNPPASTGNIGDVNLIREFGQEDFPEKQMAPHSSILARRIPWTEEPGRL